MDSSPKINASGHVVWYGSGGSDGGSDNEIFYYDGTTVTQLTEKTHGLRNPPKSMTTIILFGKVVADLTAVQILRSFIMTEVQLSS